MSNIHDLLFSAYLHHFLENDARNLAVMKLVLALHSIISCWMWRTSLLKCELGYYNFLLSQRLLIREMIVALVAGIRILLAIFSSNFHKWQLIDAF